MPLARTLAELVLRMVDFNHTAAIWAVSVVSVVLWVALGLIGLGFALRGDNADQRARSDLGQAADTADRRSINRKLRIRARLERLGSLILLGCLATVGAYWIGILGSADSLVDAHEANEQRLEAEHEADLERLEAALASATTEDELAALALTDIAAVRSVMVDHPAMTETLQVQLARDPVWAVRYDLANTGWLSPAAAMELAHDESSLIRKAVAGKVVSPVVLTFLLHDPDLGVAVEAFKNAHTPLEARCAVIHEILESSKRYQKIHEGDGHLVDYCVSVAEATIYTQDAYGGY